MIFTFSWITCLFLFSFFPFGTEIQAEISDSDFSKWQITCFPKRTHLWDNKAVSPRILGGEQRGNRMVRLGGRRGRHGCAHIFPESWELGFATDCLEQGTPRSPVYSLFGFPVTLSYLCELTLKLYSLKENLFLLCGPVCLSQDRELIISSWSGPKISLLVTPCPSSPLQTLCSTV